MYHRDANFALAQAALPVCQAVSLPAEHQQRWTRVARLATVRRAVAQGQRSLEATTAYCDALL